MSYFADILTGAQIHSVLADTGVTYIMLSNGTQVTIQGVVRRRCDPLHRSKHIRQDGTVSLSRPNLHSS